MLLVCSMEYMVMFYGGIVIRGQAGNNHVIILRYIKDKAASSHAINKIMNDEWWGKRLADTQAAVKLHPW